MLALLLSVMAEDAMLAYKHFPCTIFARSLRRHWYVILITKRKKKKNRRGGSKILSTEFLAAQRHTSGC